MRSGNATSSSRRVKHTISKLSTPSKLRVTETLSTRAIHKRKDALASQLNLRQRVYYPAPLS